MIKVVNVYNHYDVNRELCSTHLFLWWLCPFLKGGIKYKQYSSDERRFQTLSIQYVSEHANPCFRILPINPKKGTINGFFVGIIVLGNIKWHCMKWESQDENKHDLCGLQ
jgi:hypothetical protein